MIEVQVGLVVSRGACYPYWRRLLQDRNISFVDLDCWSESFYRDAVQCTHLLWHFPHWDTKMVEAAKRAMPIFESAGIVVFPSFHDAWHYDDKISQELLFQAINIKTVPGKVFFRRADALDYINCADLPIVTKLASGAGSSNVRLIKNRRSGRRVVNQMFSIGKHATSPSYFLSEGLRQATLSLAGIKALLKGLLLFFKFSSKLERERGYFYCQEFGSGNDCDIRVIVVGKRAFGFRRMVRANDFRASGSGVIDYNCKSIPLAAVELAFVSSEQLNTTCCAFDIIVHDNEYKVIEISYMFNHDLYLPCEGLWSRDLSFKKESVFPAQIILDMVLANEKETK